MENLNGMEIVYLPISSLTPYDRNAKEHPRKQIDQIKRSISDYGMRDPIGIWGENNTIVEGHGRWMACKDLGFTEVPCIRLDDMTDEQRREYALVHNQTTMNSDFDLGVLDLELGELPEFDASFYDFDVSQEEAEIEDDEVPDVPEEPKARVGDIYQLGLHRLMCGDSTSDADVRRLMNGQSAKMLFTSPPYSDMRDYNGDKDLSVTNLCRFISTYSKYTSWQCVNLGIQRANKEVVPYWDEYIKEAHNCGYKLLSWNVWDKLDCGAIGQHRAFFPLRHEFIFVFGVDTFEINATWEKEQASITDENARKVRQRDGSMKLSICGDGTKRLKKMESVLQLRSERGAIRSDHPAVFPVGLPYEYIVAMTDETDNVIEPFGGSGSTLIACEQTNRNCYMMELDPHYVDVIIERWERFTGEKAVKLNG